MVAGRPASLPSNPPEQRVTGTRYMFIAAKSGRRYEIDFSGTGLGSSLESFFVTVFDDVAGPLGTTRSIQAARMHAWGLRSLMHALARIRPVPTAPASFPRSAFLETRLQVGPRQYDRLRFALRRRADQFSPDVRELLHARGSKRPPDGQTSGLSASELDRVLDAARADVRAARDRIRPNLHELERWRRGVINDPVLALRLRLLDGIATTGDCPRYDNGLQHTRMLREAGFKNGAGALSSVFLTAHDAVAFGILLVGLTGHNMSTLESMRTPLHHASDKPDSPDDAIVAKALKPRRGKSRAAMTISAFNTPDATASRGRTGDLRNAHNVFALLEALTAPARNVSGADHLFSWVSHARAHGIVHSTIVQGTKVRPQNWASGHGILADDGTPLELTFRRLRLTFVTARDRPVAHSRRTLRQTYQAKNTRELHKYQLLVATVLDEQVRVAQSTHHSAFLSEADLVRLSVDPASGAKVLGLPVRVAERLLTGNLDTVLTACVDNENGPHNDGPCRASFLLCAGCPCAVAMPTHWPMLVATHRRLLQHRDAMTEIDWARRFGEATARLTQLIDQIPAGAGEKAMAQLTTEQSALIDRLLGGGMDA